MKKIILGIALLALTTTTFARSDVSFSFGYQVPAPVYQSRPVYVYPTPTQQVQAWMNQPGIPQTIYPVPQFYAPTPIYVAPTPMYRYNNTWEGHRHHHSDNRVIFYFR